MKECGNVRGGGKEIGRGEGRSGRNKEGREGKFA